MDSKDEKPIEQLEIENQSETKTDPTVDKENILGYTNEKVNLDPSKQFECETQNELSDSSVPIIENESQYTESAEKDIKNNTYSQVDNSQHLKDHIDNQIIEGSKDAQEFQAEKESINLNSSEIKEKEDIIEESIQNNIEPLSNSLTPNEIQIQHHSETNQSSQDENSNLSNSIIPDHDALSGQTKKYEDGWRFYYSPEGYPYFYNEISGESEWAPTDQDYSNYTISNEDSSQWQVYNSQTSIVDYQEEALGKVEESSESEEYEDSGDENDSDEQDDDSEDDSEEDDDDDDDDEFDEEFENKFKAFLRTPEGMALVLTEQERIEKYLEKKSKKEALTKDQEYVRTLLINKKTDGDNSTLSSLSPNIFQNLLSGFAAITVPLNSKANTKDDDSKNERAKRRKQVDRELKNKLSNQNISVEDLEEQPVDSKSVSRSDSNSELESLSSDDSDVQVITAPVLSELPEWLRGDYIYQNLILPTNDFFETNGIYTFTNNLGNSVLTNGSELASNAITTSFSLTSRTLSTASLALYDLLVVSGQATYPLLKSFMDNLIDNNITQNPTNTTRDISTSQEFSSSSSPSIPSPEKSNDIQIPESA